MAKIKNSKKQKYRKSLYSNLIMACVLSECKEEPLTKSPQSFVMKNPLTIKDKSARRTFVMRWNPEASSYKVSDFEYAMEDFGQHDIYFDWTVFDYQDVRVGDRFFMLKVGTGNTGIVMSGIIVGLPYKSEEYSRRNEGVHYVRMIPEYMVHPNKTSIVTIQYIDRMLPGVNWNEGSSGVLLTEEQASTFEKIWHNYANQIRT